MFAKLKNAPDIQDIDTTALVRSSARLVSAVVESLPGDELEALDQALAAGAFPVVEVVPAPSKPRVHVVLIGANGSRHTLAHLALRRSAKCLH